MTLRIATVAFVLAAAFAGVAAAAHWNGAGWYVVEDAVEGVYVVSGPYASIEACEPNRPEPKGFSDFDCEYLGTQPSWDV